MEMDIPMVSFPGQKRLISPTLNTFQKTLLSEKTKSYFINPDSILVGKLYVLKGYKEFSAHLFHEREYVEFEIQIDLFNTKNTLVKTCKANSFYEAKSMDASLDYINQLYNKAIET